MRKSHFDLIVIGGGSGGIAAAETAASYGAKVALIEMSRLGGTCANLGCVPKKILWYASQMAEFSQVAADYGFSGTNTLDYKKFVNHREHFIKHLNEVYEQRLKKNKITYIHGRGQFVNSNTILVNHQHYTASHIIIATGCSPIRPNIRGIEFAIDSNEFFDLEHLPKKIAIIGSGYIAVEFASMLNQLGSEVTVVMRRTVLRNFDSLLSDSAMEIMSTKGIKFLSDRHLTDITRTTHKKMNLLCSGKKLLSNLDCVMIATGRKPQLELLNISAVKIKTNQSGFIVTDKWERTTIPHIYAIGDVTGKKLLTPVAIAAGRHLSTRIFGKQKKSHLNYKNIPSVVFCHPPIGTIGLTEQQATDKYGRDQLIIYQKEFYSLFYALSEHRTPSRMKLITLKKNEKIIGCHLIGLGADEILQGFAVAIKMGATKKDLEDTLSIHPSSAEELLSIKKQ